MRPRLTTRDDGITVLERPARPRQYPWRGAVVNPDCPAPSSPGQWVDERRCAVCGARYVDHRGSYDGQEAARRLRDAAKAAGDDSGGFRSRRAVLWWLRVLKLEDWYLAHLLCGSGWDPINRCPYPLEDRKMERARLPEVIDLRNEDRPDVWYVRGHHDPDDDLAPYLLEAVGLAAEDDADARGWENTSRPRLAIGRQLWARWGWMRDEDGELTPRGFYVRPEKTRGAFAVTEVYDLEARERARSERAARQAYEARLSAFARAWFPEALDVHPHGYPLGDGHVRVRLPDLAGEIGWCQSRPDAVNVQTRDLDLWAERYQGRRPPLDRLEAAPAET